MLTGFDLRLHLVHPNRSAAASRRSVGGGVHFKDFQGGLP